MSYGQRIFSAGHGQACITDQRLYLASRNIHGLVYMDLQAPGNPQPSITEKRWA